jgi:glycogen debranching enzyme
MRKLILLSLLLLFFSSTFANMDDATEIAKRDLRSLYREDGIYAGPTQFSDYWARDALFATLGSNAIGDFHISRKQLALFIEDQNDEGQIPMRVGDYDITLKMFGMGLAQDQKPRYTQDKMFTKPLDQNCLLVIAAEDYVSKSGDRRFARENFNHFEDSIKWLAETDKNGNFLVEEGNYAGWTDSVKKNGEVLYTNVCYYKALTSLSKLAEVADQPAKVQIYSMWAELVRSRINENFWLDEGYYADWVNGGTKYTYFSTEANTLAILWDVADDEQAKQVLSYAESQDMRNAFAVQTTKPEYDSDLISPINRIVGIEDYHSNIRWLWVSCLYAQALNEQGFSSESEELFTEITDKMVEYDEVYEVYEPSGKPVDRMFYKSEHPFAWSSGVCLSAFDGVADDNS